MKKRKLKTIVYDKWLHSLGGGEVVACSIARILKDEGHHVIFISGKEISPEIILNKLKINLKDIQFKQVWNDETAIKKLTKGKDLFINISFMDYTIGFARKNIYYVNFPTKLYDSFRGMLVNSLILPVISKFIKPMESLNKIEAPVIIHWKPSYALGAVNKYALSNLNPGRIQQVDFKIFLESFYKSILESFEIFFDNAELVSKTVKVNHNSSTMVFSIKFKPASETAYLNLNISGLELSGQNDNGKIYLFYPEMYLSKVQSYLFHDFFQKAVVRLRAGIFTNVGRRLSTYQDIVTYSAFAWKWIKKYWNREAIIIAPPVDMLFKKYNIKNIKKKDWICSVGRFFTLGHGKKQEIMIEAFKRIYDQGHRRWQLHLVGGLGDEPSSIEFFKHLKEQSQGYPIFFHINVSAKEVEEVYLKSKIYWHATGFGEDENYQPIRFEHFGISPIEAVSAGCLPILFNGGGLPEIIETMKLDKSKHLFRTIDDLARLTINQIKNPEKILWPQMFKLLEENYSAEVFKKKFLKLIT